MKSKGNEQTNNNPLDEHQNINQFENEQIYNYPSKNNK